MNAVESPEGCLRFRVEQPVYVSLRMGPSHWLLEYGSEAFSSKKLLSEIVASNCLRENNWSGLYLNYHSQLCTKLTILKLFIVL